MHTTHNSYDICEHELGFKITSHNFPTHEGFGKTEQAAADDLNRKLMYFADNSPKEFKALVQSRVKRGLSCECGVKLEEKPLGVYLPRKSKAHKMLTKIV